VNRNALFVVWLLLSFSVCVSAFATHANPATFPQLNIPFISTAQIVIDGDIASGEWDQGTTIALNNVVQPFNNRQAPVSTQVTYKEDGRYLYVLFVAHDPQPTKIRARYVDRDQNWGDDLVGIKLDTFGDSRLAYQFFVNPFGIQMDAIENEMTGNESDSWNTVWQSAGQITETGYQVEIAIPLHALNFAQTDGVKTWGIEFVRFYPREYFYRITHVPFDRNNACALCQMAKASGFANAQQGRNLDVIPTLVGGYAQSRELTANNTADDWRGQRSSDIGLDINWGITPEISLQGTINPDFSQVESDVAQISVNNTFALFFPEKRPFFVENADYFSSMYNLIYTRNINAPEYGVKLTGRLDQHSVGVFFANDVTTNFLIPGNLGSRVTSLDKQSNNLALRYRYDINDDLALGLVSTLRSSDDYHNYVTGLDMKWTPTTKDNLRIQWVRSDTHYPDDLFQSFCGDDACQQAQEFSEAALRTKRDEAFSGNSWRIDYRHNTEDYFVRAGHYHNGADFRGDMGFVSRVDRIISVLGGGYFWRNENADSWWTRVRLSGDWDIHHNANGELIENEIEAFVQVLAKYDTVVDIGQTRRVRVGLRHDPSRLAIDNNTTQFDEYVNRVILESRPSKQLRLFQRFAYGDQIDFANDRIGQRRVSESFAEYQVNRHLKARVNLEQISLAAQGASVFDAQVVDARLTYQFDENQFLRVIVNVSEVERNVENYIDDVSAYYRDLGVQLLYSYKVTPLTKFFIGYSDAGYQDAVEGRLRSNERSVFFKISYAYSQ
jgi:hypothetical protein